MSISYRQVISHKEGTGHQQKLSNAETAKSRYDYGMLHWALQLDDVFIVVIIVLINDLQWKTDEDSATLPLQGDTCSGLGIVLKYTLYSVSGPQAPPASFGV